MSSSIATIAVHHEAEEQQQTICDNRWKEFLSVDYCNC